MNSYNHNHRYILFVYGHDVLAYTYVGVWHVEQSKVLLYLAGHAIILCSMLLSYLIIVSKLFYILCHAIQSAIVFYVLKLTKS
jgi:hypothetical protein